MKFLVRFDQNVEYKRPTGAYGLRDFYEFCIICNEFQDTLAVKTWMDLLKGLGFHQAPGRPKTLSFFVSLFVCHAFERQSLCARFLQEGLGVQKQF